MAALAGLTRPALPGDLPFLRAIAGGDDTARLVYADWLQEHDPDQWRADLMRLPRVDGASLVPGKWSVCRRESIRHANGRYTDRLRRTIIRVIRLTPSYAVTDRWRLALDTLTQCYRLDEVRA